MESSFRDMRIRPICRLGLTITTHIDFSMSTPFFTTNTSLRPDNRHYTTDNPEQSTHTINMAKLKATHSPLLVRPSFFPCDSFPAGLSVKQAIGKSKACNRKNGTTCFLESSGVFRKNVSTCRYGQKRRTSPKRQLVEKQHCFKWVLSFMIVG